MPDRCVDRRVLPSRLARYLLPALFAILTTAIGGVTWRFYAGQKELTRRAAQSQLLTVADAKVREISEWRKGRLGEAHAFMADTFAAAAFERVIEGKAAASERAAAVDYLRSICTNMHYAGAVLADLEGRPVLWEGRRFGDSSHLKSLMRSVIQAGDVVDRDFDVAELAHAPHLGLNLPLRAGAGRPIFGGLLLSIDPQDFLYPLQAWPVPSRSAEVLLVRREGESVLFLTPVRGRTDAALRLRVSIGRGDMAVVMAVQGRQGNVEAVDHRGVPVFAALRPVPGTAWYLIAKIDAEEVGEPIRRRSILLGVTAVSLILAASAVMLFLWRRYQIRREFNAQLDGRVEERMRVARELHDTLLQSFQASLIQMQAARNVLARRPEKAEQSLDKAITTAAGAVAEGRDAIQNLRFHPAGGGDLAQLLTAAGQDLAHSEEAPENPPVFRLTVEGEPRDLEPQLQDEVYRIARELLRNAFRHAHAGRIEAEIRYESRQLRLHVRDDGKGIGPEVLKAGGRAGHWGLLGIRERAGRFGGKLEFWSEAGAGTEAVLTVPAAAAYANSNGGAFSFLRRKLWIHER